ncbi:molybdenum cofactor guanylyltransferase MobA [Rhizobium leguminosarum]|uniref:molybdenum cofactor guanylyltransferase MobA n=1 Tax=Rhizobium TaxID=379 RepID=UPI001478B646|nr:MULTISPECIES: molybdenum cofactor guanylyltransferase MobA [Rhizobium]MBY5353303.1 molybdenum cofactor guanylyltransferase MobA [Rhizobium leguminosarum]MBY5365511.1 molybdenum cofactor guanylyltransferase MobA [Rhizobium leguminosarum]MBY5449403.1 molybdenum cofactor guanylyltransferase MobA [Rhizobium leguminosarum]NNH41430.1 molybdenum cofactor guanylyltransferase MobA [Rhizobium laguerreae]UWM83807.1 molybdenum cofactor guanylyltransferase MobA [Rhizobium leguminosarum bv. viciae]
MAEFSLDKSHIAGVVLAGGRSQRMGRDKAGVMLGAESLLRHVLTRLSQQALLVAVNADAAAEDLPVVPDYIRGKAGPMAGIHAAMVYAASLPSITHVVTVSVDCPFFPADLVARLAAAVEHSSQIAIAASEGRSHPVFGLWPVTLAADLEAWIATDEKRRVRDFLLRHDVTEVAFPLHPTRASLLDPFFNINTPDDLVEAERWLEALRA